MALFLAGLLSPIPDVALSTMTIYQTINTAMFMFPAAGGGITGSIRVGNSLGAGSYGVVAAAARAGWVLLVHAGCYCASTGLILHFVPHTYFPSLFTPDKAVVTEMARTIPFLACYVVADGIQTALNRVMKGYGRQCVTVPIVLVANWCMG